MNSKNFYCQKLCGENNFSIEKWNEDFKAFIALDIPIKQKSYFSLCQNQCEDCLNIVLDTKLKNKKKYGW